MYRFFEVTRDQYEEENVESTVTEGKLENKRNILDYVGTLTTLSIINQRFDGFLTWG